MVDLVKYMRKLKILLKRVLLESKYVFSAYRFGFVTGHYYLDNDKLGQLKKILNQVNNKSDAEIIIKKYENKMASMIGDGYGLSFAAGRMAFFTLLKVLGVGEGDEVILLGFTCSVMPNAVLRAGAVPVFADVDLDTFGSDPHSIEKMISPRTKMIVAQHSFGIPCNIEEIVKIGRKHNIFVLEDCAITFDSSINGKKVGNYGDAAIYSTDHTKPLNTIIGGFIYTRNQDLNKSLVDMSKELSDLSYDHQVRLYNQLLYEKKHYHPTHYPHLFITDHFKRFRRNGSKTVYLEEDYTKNPSSGKNYPYPARMPAFLAQLGLFELERWESEKKKRKRILADYLEAIKNSPLKDCIPRAYKDSRLDIVPLRFVYNYHDFNRLLNIMRKYIDINLTWFKLPIICSNNNPWSLGYYEGSCRTAEKACLTIVNWPCIIPDKWENKILSVFKKVMKELI